MLKKIASKFKKKRFFATGGTNFSKYSLNWKTTEYMKTYANSVYVFAAVRKRAEKVGQIQFTLHKGDKQIENDEVLSLLYKPNKFQSKNEFFELYQIYKDLAGSTYIYVERDGRKVVGLHNLRPDWVTELRSQMDGSILGYEYGQGKKVKFKAEDVIASHYPAPLSQAGGQSPIQTGRRVIDAQIQLEEYHANVLHNGGKLEGIFNVKAEYLSPEQIKELKKSYQQGYAGAQKSGLPFFAYGGMEYQNLGLTPSELSYIDSKKFTRADILALYGVPLAIIDSSDLGALGSNGYDAALKIFLSETIQPLQDSLVQKLNEFLVDPDKTLGYIDPSPANTELILKEVESGVKNYYMTTNEARQMWGLSPIKGGDVINVPLNLFPQEVAVEKQAIKKKSFEHPLKNKEFREKYYKGYRQGLSKDIEKFKKQLERYLKEQKDRVLGNDKKDFVSDRFNFAEENKIGIQMMLPIMEEIFTDSGQEIFNLFGEGSFTFTPRAKESLERRAEFFINEINETTFKELTQTFENSIEDNLTRAELVDAVADLYDQRITDTRAETIVRTETHHAIEEAKLDGYDQVGVPIKIWVHNPISEHPRAEHMAIDGEEQPLREPFSNGLMYPGDGDAAESINCNCTI